jgi:hypothetical protein
MSVEAGRRELINFRRVSLLPELRLEVTDMLMPFIKSKTSINAGIGNIEEENLLKTKRSFVSFEIKQPILVLKYINLYALLNYDYYKYGQGSMWKKVSGKMDLSGSSKYFDFSLGYLNMFQNTGASPFNFDKYQAVLNDEIYWSAALGKLDSKIGINFYYDLNRKNYRYKEYNFTFKLCKWRFKIMWEAIERNLGVSLALTN